MIGLTVFRLIIFVSFLHCSLSRKCYFCQDKQPRGTSKSKRDDTSGNATAGQDVSGVTTVAPTPSCSAKTEKKCEHPDMYCVYMRTKKDDGSYDYADCQVFFKELVSMPESGVKDICSEILKNRPELGKVENCYSCRDKDLCNTMEEMEAKGEKPKSGVEGVKQRRSLLLEIFTVLFSVFMLKIYY